MMRINKYLARCGVASRRTADLMVSRGRVTVNGHVIDTPGYMIDEITDLVRVDGKPIAPADSYVYIALNKPAGYITSLRDPYSRPDI